MTSVKHSQILWTVLFLFGAVLLCPPVYAKILYVDDDATGTNDGTSWANAYVFLQDALAEAEGSERPVEVRVAQGTYKPDRGANHELGSRRASFPLADGVAIKGGYAGAGEIDPNARDIHLYLTILSGDLAGNDTDVDDARELAQDPNLAENSYHVVASGSGNDSTTTLDGVTVTGGNALPLQPPFSFGGGLHDTGRGSLTLVGCTFSHNVGEAGGGVSIYRYHRGSVTLMNCEFIDNYGGRDGGGVLVVRAQAVTLANCKFNGNVSGHGGGAFSTMSDLAMGNCILTGNSAYERGGAICFMGILTLRNCTISGNRAMDAGGGIWKTGGDYSSIGLNSCILWGNVPDNLVGVDTVLDTVSYSNIQEGWPGECNIDVNPLFVNPGQWGPNGTPDDPNDDTWVNGDYHLLRYSPCIDAGDPGFIADPNNPIYDVYGGARFIGTRIDIGADEFSS